MKDSQQRLPSIVTPRELNLPVKVVDDEGKEIVRPDVLQAVVQLASLGQLARIRKSVEKEEFEGKKDSRTLNATDQLQWIDLIDRYPNKPWATATFFNDGPVNRVYIAINDAYDWTLLNFGETLPVDYTKADKRISLIYYRCDAGNTASVRVVGKY